MIELKVFIQNAGINGVANGEWIQLPMDQDELKEIVKKHGDFIIGSYEGFEVKELDNIFEINQTLLDYGEEVNADELEALMEFSTDGLVIDIESIVQGSVGFHRFDNMVDFARHYVEEHGWKGKEIPEELHDYMDYDKIARELSFMGYNCYHKKGIIVIF